MRNANPLKSRTGVVNLKIDNFNKVNQLNGGLFFFRANFIINL